MKVSGGGGGGGSGGGDAFGPYGTLTAVGDAAGEGASAASFMMRE